ncbi:hypothetical protein SLEP1_g18549 [Rubroshorea leprosula]|uniref:Uncharacterized protein n=1 Tax=Rubroshorea leprosula TaxID=152421 RepID=A0AAV5J6Y0_9ROSI|nr:hypothetical protein SLEP1_g18549 [Rubroshorea leprosula]
MRTMDLGPISQILSMAIMSLMERDVLLEEMCAMHHTTKRFKRAWEEAIEPIKATQPMKEIHMGFSMQGLRKAGLIPEEEHRVHVGTSASPEGLEAKHNVIRPLLRVEVEDWGRRTLLVALPVDSAAGHYGYRSWRPVEEESLNCWKVHQQWRRVRDSDGSRTHPPFDCPLECKSCNEANLLEDGADTAPENNA